MPYLDKLNLIDAMYSAPASMSVCINTDECHGMMRMKQHMMSLVSSFPDADVVPVVRCTDCKHWHRSLSDDGKIEFFNFSHCEKGHHGFPNFFCADGERKDGDGE